jgi:hypothetical protein
MLKLHKKATFQFLLPQISKNTQHITLIFNPRKFHFDQKSQASLFTPHTAHFCFKTPEFTQLFLHRKLKKQTMYKLRIRNAGGRETSRFQTSERRAQFAKVHLVQVRKKRRDYKNYSGSQPNKKKENSWVNKKKRSLQRKSRRKERATVLHYFRLRFVALRIVWWFLVGIVICENFSVMWGNFR